MDNKCGIPATAQIRILSLPPEGTFFELTDNLNNSFLFTFTNGGEGAKNNIANKPLIDIYLDSHTLQELIENVAQTIRDIDSFGEVVVDPITSDIWIDQKTEGPDGNKPVVLGPWPEPQLATIFLKRNFAGGAGPAVNPTNSPFSRSGTAFSRGLNVGKDIPEAEREFNLRKKRDARQRVEQKKKIKQIKKQAKKCRPLPKKKKKFLLDFLKNLLCDCPVCSPLNQVTEKIAGRNYFKIPFTEFKIPRLDHLINKTAGFDQNRRPGEKCGACDGKKKLPDIQNDSGKYQQVAQKMENDAPKIMEREAELGLGGARTTLIQGSDVLFVGLGFNNNKAHETVSEGAIAPSMKGGKIPQQNATKVSAVVGKQAELGWPQQVGNYTIKCANKFNVLAGAGGITLSTPGPLTLNSSGFKMNAPNISLGCATGPLLLEGESVNIAGKAISITPSGGELFVKGNINNTGNITTQGHAHFESVSFAKASCVGTNKTTSQATANPDVLNTEKAVWGSAAMKTALLDIKTFYQSVPADSRSSAFKLASPKVNENISSRMSSMAKLALPFEAEVTGFIIPGTKFTAIINGTPASVEVTSMCDIHNKPHVHGIPEMKHTHEIQLPDIDYTSDTPEAMREKVLTGAHECGAPQNPVKDTGSRLDEAKRTASELAANTKAEATKKIAQLSKFSFKLPNLA